MLTKGCFSCPCVVNKYVLKVLERERIKELMVRSRIDDPLGDPQGEDLAMLGPVAKARGPSRLASTSTRYLVVANSLSMSLSCSIMPSNFLVDLSAPL